MSDWHSRLQRSQHLAAALAERDYHCYTLNPHLGRQYRRIYLRERGARAVALGKNLTELHARLQSEPVYHHRLLSARETRDLAAAIAPIAAGKTAPVVQILSFPTWGELALLLRERHGWPIVYDCHDLLEGFPRIAREIVDAEHSLLERSDFVVFSSEYLRLTYTARLSIPPGKMVLLRNAVDSGFMRFTAPPPAQSPPRPMVAGYIGALDTWFDIEAVRHAAVENPTVVFRLIGRVEHAPIRALASLPNVEFIGEVPHDSLPGLLAGFSAGLIPFVVNELTRAANPIKLYEYFSAGLPVVSSHLPEVELHSGLVYFAASPSDFASQVALAVAEDDSAQRGRRIRIAASETWDRRAAELLNALAPQGVIPCSSVSL